MHTCTRALRITCTFGPHAASDSLSFLSKIFDPLGGPDPPGTSKADKPRQGDVSKTLGEVVS